MYRFLTAAALAAAGIFTPGIAQTQATSGQANSAQEIVTFAAWRDRVQKALDRGLHYARPMPGMGNASGIVRVKFNCSDTGRPDKVTIARSSGSRRLDRMALKAVDRIATLHPLPQGFRHDQSIEAMILIAYGSEREYRQKRDRMIAEAKRRNARFDDPQRATAGVLLTGAAGG